VRKPLSTLGAAWIGEGDRGALTPLEFRASRRKNGLGLCASLGFVAIGAFMLRYGEPVDAPVFWLIILFFGAGSPRFLWRLIDPRPRLVLDRRGILDRTLGVGIIPWDEITAVSVRRVGDVDFIGLDLRNPEQFVAKRSRLKRVLSRVNRASGYTAPSLNLSVIAVDPYVLLDLILACSDAVYRGPAGGSQYYADLSAEAWAAFQKNSRR
jgi:hypothetical protein